MSKGQERGISTIELLDKLEEAETEELKEFLEACSFFGGLIVDGTVGVYNVIRRIPGRFNLGSRGDNSQLRYGVNSFSLERKLISPIFR